MVPVRLWYDSMMSDATKTSSHRKAQAAEPATDIETMPPPGGRGFTIGRDAFARISAVEGLRLSDDMKRDLRELQRKGLSGEARRRAIISKYGKKPA